MTTPPPSSKHESSADSVQKEKADAKLMKTCESSDMTSETDDKKFKNKSKLKCESSEYTTSECEDHVKNEVKVMIESVEGEADGKITDQEQSIGSKGKGESSDNMTSDMDEQKSQTFSAKAKSKRVSSISWKSNIVDDEDNKLLCNLANTLKSDIATQRRATYSNSLTKLERERFEALKKRDDSHEFTKAMAMYEQKHGKVTPISESQLPLAQRRHTCGGEVALERHFKKMSLKPADLVKQGSGQSRSSTASRRRVSIKVTSATIPGGIEEVFVDESVTETSSDDTDHSFSLVGDDSSPIQTSKAKTDLMLHDSGVKIAPDVIFSEDKQSSNRSNVNVYANENNSKRLLLSEQNEENGNTSNKCSFL